MPDHDPDAELDLEALAPEVDVVGAASAFGQLRHRRARRRRAALGGLGAVVILVGGIALAQATDDAGDRQVVTGPPDGDGSAVPATSSTTSAPDTVPPGSLDPPPDAEGVALSIEEPSLDAVAGGRLWVTVRIENRRDEPIVVSPIAGCDVPVRVVVGSDEAIRAVRADNDPDSLGSPMPWQQLEWDGDPGSIAETVARIQQPKVFVGRSRGELGSQVTRCSRTVPPAQMIEAGESLERSVFIDLRWVSTAGVDGRAFEAVVASGPVRVAGTGEDLGRRELVLPVVLTDPIAPASLDAALASVATTPTLDRWLSDQQVDTWSGGGTASIAWWRAAWEVWLWAPSGEALRIRFDAETGEVSEVRSVTDNATPTDDPDAFPEYHPVPPGTERDAVRYRGG